MTWVNMRNRVNSMTRVVASLMLLMAAVAAAATTNTYHVVAGNPGAQAPFDTWDKAAADIQTAVNRASADLVPGTTECVVLVSNGTYNLTGQITVTNGIVLRSLSGRDATFINGNFPAYTNRCLFITGDATVDGFTLTNGYAAAFGATPATTNLGGGIYAYGCNALIQNCTIVMNATLTNGATGNCGLGGGVALGAGASQLRDCYIATNRTITQSTGAGGIYLHEWTGVVANCTITTNLGASLGSGTGAGIFLTSSSAGVISNCTISRNLCRFNAGVQLAGGALLTDCVIANNWSLNGNGGLVVNAANAVVRNCTVISNYAGQVSGAGIAAYNGLIENTAILFNRGPGYNGAGLYLQSATVRNCLIAGNKVTGVGLGGGVYMGDYPGTLINCTIVNNQSDTTNGAGLYTIASNRPSIFRNLIVCDNQSANGTAVNIAASTNLPNWQDGFAFCFSPDLTAGVNSNRTGDPLFASPGTGYGTNAALGDYALQPGSPCIDAGTNQGWMATARDLAGNARIRPFWKTVDMGAYEAPPSLLGPLTAGFTVAPLTGAAPLQVAFNGEVSGDANGVAWQWIWGDGTTNDWSADSSVSHTYAAARTNAYTVILNVTNGAGEFAASTNASAIMVYPAVAYVATNGAHVAPFDTWDKAANTIQAAVDVAGAGLTTVVVSNGVYVLTNEITIGKAITVRGASGNWADTVLRGAFPASTNRCLTLSGAGAVVDGLTITNGNVRATGAGGGINMTANATIRNCLIIGNTATGSSATFGGGIAASDGTVLHCEIRNNASLQVGGGGIYAAGTGVLISECLIANNRTATAGGGMQLSGATVAGCVISNNVAGTSGGGVYKSNSGGGTVRNSLLSGNQAASLGGGIYMGQGNSLNIENCTIVGNSSSNGGGVFLPLTTHQGVNCIVAFNQATGTGATNNIVATNAVNFSFSCSPDLANGVSNNITADPRFVRAGSGSGTNLVAGDDHLRVGSPCVDTGTVLSWMAAARDLDGNPRTMGAGPNMGVYEKPVVSQGSMLQVH